MRIKSNLKNLILYLFLTALIAAGTGHTSVPALTERANGQAPVLDAPSPSYSIDFWTEQVSSRHSGLSFTTITQNIRTGSSYRSGILFLLSALTLSSVFSRFNEKRILFHDNRFVYRKVFTISFMHDADGRKRTFCALISPVAVNIR